MWALALCLGDVSVRFRLLKTKFSTFVNLNISQFVMTCSLPSLTMFYSSICLTAYYVCQMTKDVIKVGTCAQH